MQRGRGSCMVWWLERALGEGSIVVHDPRSLYPTVSCSYHFYRYAVAMRTGVIFSHRGLWRMFSDAEADASLGAVVGSASAPPHLSLLRPFEAVEAVAAAGSESVGGLFAAASLPPRVTLFRWSALSCCPQSLEGGRGRGLSPLHMVLGTGCNEDELKGELRPDPRSTRTT